MLKSFFVIFSSLFARGGESQLMPFLDYEQRPEAVAIEKSFVKINEIESGFEVFGGLGSIPSTYRDGEFVGFSGVEVSEEIIEKKKGGSKGLFFNFENEAA